MEKRINLEVRGVISLTSELHVSAFGDWTPVEAQGRADNTVPTAKKKIAKFKIKRQIEADDDSSFVEQAPTAKPTLIAYVAGNSVRGRLRRIAADKIKQALIEKDQGLKPNAYYLINCGSTSTQGAKGAYSVLRHKQVRDDLFLGIFGAETDYMSRLITPDIIPVLKETLELGMVPAEFESFVMPIEPYQMYNVFTLTKKDDFIAQRDAMAPDVVIDYENAYHELAKDRLQNVAARKEDAAVKKTDFENIISFEAVMAGTAMYFTVGARNIRPDQAGLLISSIGELTHTRPLGGNARYGLGRFTGSLDLIVDGERLANEIVITTGGTSYGEYAAAYIDACSATLDGYSNEILQEFADESDRLRLSAAESKQKKPAPKSGVDSAGKDAI